MVEVQVAVPAEDELGEGPVWCASTRELLRVDIARGRVHTWKPDTGESTVASFDGEVSAAVPRHGGGLVVAVERELRLVAPDEPPKVIASVEPGLADNRFNDCRCDSYGRLWAGTMSRSRTPGTAGLYRLDPGHEIQMVVEGTTLSNGIGWSPSGETMYFIDSTTQRIDAFDFDGPSGRVSGRRAFAEVDPADGMPDGLTVDFDGGVWVALFGGGVVRRYSADGQLDMVATMPVPHPTCPAFGGPDLMTLFVTSTRHRLTAEQRRAMPLAGSVFAFAPGVGGIPAVEFAGGPRLDDGPTLGTQR